MTSTLPRETLAAPADADAAEVLDQTFLLSLVGHSARLAFSTIRPRFQREMDAFALRPSDFATLSLVAANAGISQKRLADAINVSPPNMAAILARLVERGLIARERSASDQRAQRLRLTPAGDALYTRAAAIVQQLEHESTAMLSTTERHELLRLLRKVSGK